MCRAKTYKFLDSLIFEQYLTFLQYKQLYNFSNSSSPILAGSSAWNFKHWAHRGDFLDNPNLIEFLDIADESPDLRTPLIPGNFLATKIELAIFKFNFHANFTKFTLFSGWVKAEPLWAEPQIIGDKNATQQLWFLILAACSSLTKNWEPNSSHKGCLVLPVPFWGNKGRLVDGRGYCPAPGQGA